MRTAAVYGANGSGKSNLVKAITLARSLIVDGTRPDQRIPVSPFKLNEESRKSPSRFEFVINYQDIIYTYGFAVNESEVKEEWLFAIRNVREVRLFERITRSNGKARVEFGPNIAKKKTKKHQFLSFIAEGTRPNELFLHELYQKNVKDVLPLINWFRAVLVIIGPESAYRDLIFDAYTNENFIQFMGIFLKNADTGIDSIVTEKIDPDFDKYFPEMSEKLKNDLLNIKPNVRVMLSTPEGRRYTLMREENGEIVLLWLKARHKLKTEGHVDMEIKHESDGTRRLIDLLPALLHSKSGERVYIIDEIDRSMHPLLSKKFLQAYLDDQKYGRGQIIITTHESNLLDRELLRRDEIWFTEKDEEGSTHLYSLSEYKVRPDLKLGKGYLDGRFGAIPFLGNLEKLQYCLKDR
ncbi:MAG: ATP/GTP-binding protein [Desulfobacterales bacterium]|nr:ATP/GTP-binding protein [Desulfobacterales bacterium]